MNKRILIVEDNPMVVKSLEFKLIKDGYTVATSIDGRDAKKKIETEHYDLIITDLMLPFISGIELIEFIKNKNPEIPVIVLSSSTQEDIITNAFIMGVEDFVTKPFSPNELSLRVRRTLANTN